MAGQYFTLRCKNCGINFVTGKNPNKKTKIARYRSRGLLRSGAMLRFLKTPYLSHYLNTKN